MKRLLQTTALALLAALAATTARADAVADAKAYIAEITKPNPAWTGPTTGPLAEKGKSIVYVAADLRNGGVVGGQVHEDR